MHNCLVVRAVFVGSLVRRSSVDAQPKTAKSGVLGVWSTAVHRGGVLLCCVVLHMYDTYRLYAHTTVTTTSNHR